MILQSHSLAYISRENSTAKNHFIVHLKQPQNCKLTVSQKNVFKEKKIRTAKTILKNRYQDYNIENKAMINQSGTGMTIDKLAKKTKKENN